LDEGGKKRDAADLEKFFFLNKPDLEKLGCKNRLSGGAPILPIEKNKATKQIQNEKLGCRE
jgi:hypothetical protein